MMDTVYQIDALTHRYGGRAVLSLDALTIRRGTITGLAGPNGSGKTTLLKLLSMIEAPAEGAVHFQGRVAGEHRQMIARAVTYLPQTPYLLKRTVFQNVAYGLKLRGRTDGLARRVDEVLSLVGLPLATFGHRYPGQLSGGEAQRVALAARLIVNPEVLLLDEPTANVDAESAQRIKNVVEQAKKRWETTVVVASHDLQWLYESSDQILQVYNGRVWPAGDKSVIPGPWQPGQSGCWARPLGDGQAIKVKSKPPAPEATAIVQLTGLVSGDVFPADSSGSEGVKGRISRMILEKKTGRVVITLVAGEVLLTMRVSPETVAGEKLYPGVTATVRYNADTVGWLE